MSSAPNISSITATPLSGGVNPFDQWLPDELAVEIASHIDDASSRISFERACWRFQLFATNLFEAAAKLYRFTLERPLTLEEREELRERLTHIVPNGVNVSLELIEQSKSELETTPILSKEESLEVETKVEFECDNFLKVFKKRAKEFHWEVGGIDYVLGGARALKLFDSYFRIGQRLTPCSIDQKLHSIVNKGTRKFFEESLENYARLDTQKITSHSFKNRVIFIMGCFPGDFSHENVLRPLRLAVKRKGASAVRQSQRTAEIEAMRQECLTITQNSPRYIAARESIRDKLLKKKADLEAEMLMLRGPTGFDGEINRVYQGMLTGVQGSPEYLALIDRLNFIAVFNNSGEIIGGRLLTIAYELVPASIDRAVTHLIATERRFYDLLNGDIDESEQEAMNRASTLFAILKLPSDYFVLQHIFHQQIRNLLR